MPKKDKNHLVNYDTLKAKFNIYNNTDGQKEYEEIKKFYYEIKKYYVDKKIDTKIERIRLEKNIGKYKGTLINYSIALLISLIAGFFPTIIGKLFEGNNFVNPVFISVSMFAILVFFIFTFTRDVDNERPNDLMKNIALQVINEIENNENQNTDLCVNEVAATKEIIEAKEGQPQGKYNFTMNFNLPSVLDIVVMRMFKKKK